MLRRPRVFEVVFGHMILVHLWEKQGTAHGCPSNERDSYSTVNGKRHTFLDGQDTASSCILNMCNTYPYNSNFHLPQILEPSSLLAHLNRMFW